MNLYDFFASTMLAAASELMRRQGQALKTMIKADTSVVTEADLASEKVIHDNILKYFPNDTILSEESGRTPGTGSHVWIVDPLDGTTNYSNGYPFFCISIARGRFVASGRIEVEQGAIYDPNRQRLYFAELGKGATVNGQTIKVAAPRDFAKCFLVTGFYYMREDILQKEIDRFSRVAQRCQTIRRDGAAALDLAYTAEGVYDAFWEVGLAPWDIAAGSILVREAGGSVRNYSMTQDGFDISGHGIIAGSPNAVAEIAGLL